MKVLVSGSSGFVGRYVTAELTRRGHEVVPLDLAAGQDARDPGVVSRHLKDCDHFIAAAALIGGIRYLHACPYDLLAANERITAAAFDAAIAAHHGGTLRKITVVSSSMVYESAGKWPTAEGDERNMPAPGSSYGFSKLATEYFARAAWDQHRLPYTIVRLFNVTGPGDRDHVITDLARKVLAGQDPLRILGSGRQVRCFTYAADIAEGIVTAMTHPDAANEDFNLSSATPTTVLELASLIWRKIRGDELLRVIPDQPFARDVQRRVPSVAKARDVLGFEALTPLSVMLDEVIAGLRREAA